MEEHESTTQIEAIAVEEIFHFYTEKGLGKAFPAQFGSENFSSVICTQMAELECVQPGWWHPENTCPAPNPRSAGNPASPPLQGTCAEANCDCVEFFHQAALIYIGMTPGWYSDYMPKTKAGVTAMLSSTFKSTYNDSKYGLP